MLKVASASDETLCRIGMLAINDGACFLKLVIMWSTVDTHLNVSMIWKNLATLDGHMPSVDSNVDLFNQFVLLQHEAWNVHVTMQGTMKWKIVEDVVCK